MPPDLIDLVTVDLPVGGLIGAIIGFLFRAESDSALVRNIVDGAQLGVVAATAIVLAIWLGTSFAGA